MTVFLQCTHVKCLAVDNTERLTLWTVQQHLRSQHWKQTSVNRNQLQHTTLHTNFAPSPFHPNISKRCPLSSGPYKNLCIHGRLRSNIVDLSVCSAVSIWQALLRAGRFDRHIMIDFPTLPERTEIFDMYLQKLKLKHPPKHYSERLAQLSPGRSGGFWMAGLSAEHFWPLLFSSRPADAKWLFESHNSHFHFPPQFPFLF